jgi:hypothetical protein
MRYCNLESKSSGVNVLKPEEEITTVHLKDGSRAETMRCAFLKQLSPGRQSQLR